MAGGNGNGATEFFLRTALMEFLRNLCNGNGETATACRTATEWWKLGIIP